MDMLSLRGYNPASRLVVGGHDVPVPRYPAFDFHTHFGAMFMGDNYPELYRMDDAVAALKGCGVTGVVNLDGGSGAQTDRMLDIIGRHKDFFYTFGTVDLSMFERLDFDAIVYRTLREGNRKGIRGIKIWKNLGLYLRDSNGVCIRPDDLRLAPVWQAAAEEGLPVLIHLADPKAFFDPVDCRNERYEELCAHPEWSFADQGFYSFEALMEMQERLIADNPKTTFIVAHVGSHAENLEEVGRCLSLYPNMYIDIADRIAELGRQPYTSRDFLEKYADRVVFGTDTTPLRLGHHPFYYRFLETRDEYFAYEPGDAPPRQGRWRIYGIGLSDEALKKIYYRNAERILDICIRTP